MACIQTRQHIILIALFKPHLDAGIAFCEFQEKKGHEPGRERIKAADGYFPLPAIAQRLRGPGKVFRVLQQKACIANQALPGGGEADPLGVMPHKNGYPQHGFKLRDSGGDRWLGNIEMTGRFGDISRVSGGNDIAQEAE
jgi:hypothetical protein